MRILVKNKKWETSFQTVTLICDVKAKMESSTFNFLTMENMYK